MLKNELTVQASESGLFSGAALRAAWPSAACRDGYKEVAPSEGHRRGLCIALRTHMFSATSMYREEGVASIQGLVCA